MNQFPLIGVSGSVDERERENVMMRCYARAVLSGGAMPVLLSPDMDDDMLDSCLAKLDGVLLAGGTDVDPALYGETPVYELGVNLKKGYNGDLSARENGYVGGYMVKRLVEQAERQMKGQ